MTALAATLHDPDGRMLPLLLRHASRLGGYDAAAIAVTPQTAAAVRRALETAGARPIPGGKEIGRGRRDAVAAASFHAPGADVLCIDFDRWLHWADRFPEDLAALPGRIAARRSRPWYACVGRTARAWATHPEVQRACEGPTNRALSLAAGMRLDATAGCCWLAPDAIPAILSRSTEASNATDLEWPAIVLREAPGRLCGVRAEGLEFETPTFFPREIAAGGGLAAWTAATYDTPSMWAARLRLASDSSAALARVLGRG